MNVYVRETARELGADGRARGRVHPLAEPGHPACRGAGRRRAGRPPAGGGRGAHASRGRPRAPRRVRDGRRSASRSREGLEYDLIHAHYWLSGVAGLALREAWGAPLVHMFHTLGRLKNAVAQTPAEVEPRAPDRRGDADRRRRRPHRRRQRRRAGAPRLVLRRAQPSAIAVIPCGVDTELFQPMDRAAAKRPARAAGRSRCCSTWGGSADQGPRDAARGHGAGRAEPAAAADRRRRARTSPTNGHGAAPARAQVGALGLGERVRFLGAQPQRRLRLFYAAADVTVMPSLLRVLRHGGARGHGLRQPGGRLARRRAHHDGPGRRDRPARARGRSVGAGRRARRRCSPTRGAGGSAAQAARWAAEHRWPCVAEAVCRLYSELRPLAVKHLERARCRP